MNMTAVRNSIFCKVFNTKQHVQRRGLVGRKVIVWDAQDV